MEVNYGYNNEEGKLNSTESRLKNLWKAHHYNQRRSETPVYSLNKTEVTVKMNELRSIEWPE